MYEATMLRWSEHDNKTNDLHLTMGSCLVAGNLSFDVHVSIPGMNERRSR